MSDFSYLKPKDVDALRQLASDSANRATEVLADLGSYLRKASVLLRESAASVPSLIPGHESVSYEHPVIGNFIAIISDLRDTTTRLCQAIGKPARYSLAERVYFETAITLPALAQTFTCFGGQTTEYLGDGTLTLFLVPDESTGDTCDSAYKASLSALEVLSKLVNPIIEKANLPPLAVGVGIGMSHALVSAIGLPGQLVPNAFGRCVFHAAKLSKWGVNEIYTDPFFRSVFPRSDSGKLRFKKTRRDEMDGFLLYKSSETA